MYMVSACLAGINCRYDGKNTLDERVLELLCEGKAIPLCPEVLGGLSIPRECCEMVRSEDGGYRILSASGNDYTDAYAEGARKTLEICRIAGIDTAILQQRSPSCGYGRIYDGTFNRELVEGNGVTVELLLRNGFRIHTAEDLDREDWAG